MLLTESTLKKIIRDKVHTILNEGYSGIHFKDQIISLVPKIIQWINKCNNGGIPSLDRDYFQTLTSLKINLKPFNKEGIQQKYLKNTKIPVYITYFPNEVENTVWATTRKRAKSSAIELNIGKEYSEQEITNVLLHELTHSVDRLFADYQSSWFSGTRPYTKYHHQYEATRPIPGYIQLPMYFLWDTREFNAWQANYDNLSDFVNNIMNCLEKANNDNNPKTWQTLKEYLIQANASRGLGWRDPDPGKKDFRNTPWEAVKHYYIKTTFNKLKKFIKKIKV